MSVVATLICATLVTNVGNGSIVTRECREVQPQTAMVSSGEHSTISVEEIGPKNVTDINMNLDEVYEIDAAPKAKPISTPKTVRPAVAKPTPRATSRIVNAKPAKPKRIKIVSASQHHKKRRISHAVEVLPTVTAAAQPNKKLSVWQRLKNWTAEALVNK